MSSARIVNSNIGGGISSNTGTVNTQSRRRQHRRVGQARPALFPSLAQGGGGTGGGASGGGGGSLAGGAASGGGGTTGGAATGASNSATGSSAASTTAGPATMTSGAATSSMSGLTTGSMTPLGANGTLSGGTMGADRNGRRPRWCACAMLRALSSGRRITTRPALSMVRRRSGWAFACCRA